MLAALATILASHDINIDAVLQQRVHSKDANAFVVTIEPCAPATLATALAEIAQLDFHVAPTVDLPILVGRERRVKRGRSRRAAGPERRGRATTRSRAGSSSSRRRLPIWARASTRWPWPCSSTCACA